MSNRVYDILKWICMVLLPALSTLYAAIASVWGLGYSPEITGTIAALTTFLGVVLGISSNAYAGRTDGTLYVDEKSGDVYAEFNHTPKHLADSNEARLSIENV